MTDASYQPKVYRKQGGDELVVASGGAITVEAGGSITVAGVTIDETTLALNGLTASAAELNLTDGSVVSNNVASKAALLDADKRVRTAANVGAVTTAGTTAVVEYGDGAVHTTKLTLTAFAVGLSGDAGNLARGASLYTFPAGEIIVESASINIGLTLDDAIQTDTPEIGLGTVACAGEVQATLGAVGATAEDIMEGVAVADVAGTPKVNTDIPTANVPLVIATAGSHVVNLNVADGWANLTAAAAITASGTVILNWRFMG